MKVTHAPATDLDRRVVVVARVLLLASVVAVALVTLPGLTTGGSGGTNWTPGAGIASSLTSVDRGWGLVNVLGNVVMFVPVGFSALPATGWRVRGVVLACAVGSATVEVVQLGAGRSLDVDDVLLNTAGAALGAIVAAAALVGARRLRAGVSAAPGAAED